MLTCPKDLIGDHQIDQQTLRCARCGIMAADIHNWRDWEHARQELKAAAPSTEEG